jgi:hypothetical protein
MNDIKERVEKVNRELLDLGYSWHEIMGFWLDCIKESKEKIVNKK